MKGQTGRGLEEGQGVTPDFRTELPSQLAKLVVPDRNASDLKTFPEETEVG